MYTAALHWSLTQFSPSTQPIGPQNTGERVFAALVVIFALCALSSLMSSIASYTTEIRQMSAARHSSDMLLRKFFTARQVSNSLSSRIAVFMKNASYKHKRLLHEDDLPSLKLMPESLRIRLHDELYMPVLQKSHLFKRVYDADKGVLIRMCHTCFKEASVPPRFDIFIDNTDADRATYTLAGNFVYTQAAFNVFEQAHARNKVEEQNGETTGSRKSGKTAIAGAVDESIGPDCWISEMALWSAWRYCGVLVSKTACDMVNLDAEEFIRVCTSHRSAASVILQKVAVLAVAHVENLQREEGRKPSDLSFDDDVWAQLWFRAQRFKDRELKSFI